MPLIPNRLYREDMTMTIAETTVSRNEAAAIECGPGANGEMTYLVMVAQAGRSDRTGSNVHLASLRVYADGHQSLDATRCSRNGHLRGTVVRGYGFNAVTCKRCAEGVSKAAQRNATVTALTV